MIKPRQKIIKLGKAYFRVFWEGKEKQGLRLNFNPLLNAVNNQPCVFLHWQGRPFGLRRWGVYCSTTDNYYGVDHDKITLIGTPTTLQLPETKFKTLPTAVLVFYNCKIVRNGEEVHLE